MESRGDSENAERILYNMSPKQLVSTLAHCFDRIILLVSILLCCFDLLFNN